MIQRTIDQSVRHASAKFGSACHLYASAVEDSSASLEKQLEAALSRVDRSIVETNSDAKLVSQTIFVRELDEIARAKAVVNAFYHKRPAPVSTFLAQPPCGGAQVAVEAYGLAPGDGPIDVENKSDHVAIVRQEGISWVHCAHIGAHSENQKVYERSRDAFSGMADQLAEAGVSYDRVVRTWLYLGDILGPEGDTQRYKELNRARTDYYKRFHFGASPAVGGHHFNGPEMNSPGSKEIYPASTGIGSRGDGLLVGCVALQTTGMPIELISLENPNQISAFDYAKKYSEKSPKFARAMAVVLGSEALVYISGTASITASESRHKGDVAAQTTQTLDNIEALISRENFSAHGRPQLGATLADLLEARVYIKRADDYELVRAVCEKRMAGVPIIYVEADICREELLVEIEAVAVAGV
jgi:enamine deaminase RidA (YjgF/YER057c/UK114 family)